MNRRTFAIASLTGIMLIAAAACGGDSDASDDTPTVASSTATSAALDTPAASETPASSTPAASETEAGATTALLNLNTATGDDYLATIPGFSDRMVREFLEYRPYVSIEQFRRELGKYVDEAQIAEWEQYVYVPVDVNDADAETLMQLPGVDEPIAEELIAARSYESNNEFLETLSAYVTADQLDQAAAMLAS